MAHRAGNPLLAFSNRADSDPGLITITDNQNSFADFADQYHIAMLLRQGRKTLWGK